MKERLIFIIDLNQTMIGTFMVQVGKHTNIDIDQKLFKHMVFNTLRSYHMAYKAEYGEMVIACDSRQTWRREMFPYYKAQRKADRAKTDVDWSNVYKLLNEVQDDLKRYFPYRVLAVEHTEADDIIATLTRLVCNDQPVLILSADKDFIQLQAHPNVKQIDPVRKRHITTEDAERYLFEHIVRGDRGDGIPNILSADNCLSEGVRMKPVRQTMIDKWYGHRPEQVFSEKQLAGWKRNKALIDLTMIPEKIQQQIIDEYESQQIPDGRIGDLFNYLVENQMTRLVESIGDFT